MSSQVFDIIDQSLRFALFGFLIVLTLCLLFVIRQVRARRKRLADFIDPNKEDRETITELPNSTQARLVLRSTALSGVMAVIIFFVASFVPLPYVDNFASGTIRQIAPIRVTALTYDRFFEGFSLEGELWNQSEGELRNLKVMVLIWADDDRLLDEVEARVSPGVVGTGKQATFKMEYRRNSPFIKGYQLQFFDGSGHPVPHINGFDVR